MNRKIKTCLFISLFYFSQNSVDAGWLDRKAEGWFWYEDRQKQIEKIEQSPSPLTVPDVNPPIPLTATMEMEAIRKEIEESLNRAILDPSKENVMTYMTMQKQWIDQSAQFSQQWVKNLLTYPNLDARVMDAPVTQYGVQVHKQLAREEKERKIQALTETHGLFFFYEGNNKLSQAFSFVVKEFSKKYSWQVIGISCDGILIPGFEANHIDQGLVQRLGIENFPSLFLIDPNQRKHFPIAFGLASTDQIEKNIELQWSAL